MKKYFSVFFSPCLRASVAIFLLATTLTAQEVSQSLNANWQFTESGKNDWLSATVPGTVHTDLLAHGKIPDPYIGTNESKVQWVETKTWEYKTTFDVSEKIGASKHKELVFEGLDTYAFVYLNDSLILTGENMFLEYRIDVGKYLKKTKNNLRIVFHPASELIEKNRALSTYKNLPGGDRVYIRKAQYQFGWDFGPRLVTSGIWKNVRLEGWNNFKVTYFSCTTDSVKNDTAFLSIRGYSNLPGNSVGVEINANGKKYPASKVVPVGSLGFQFTFKIPHPLLWWCNGMGKQNLYDFTFNFRNGKDSETKMLRTGIRTIRVDQSSSFTFYLNDEPVFIKGANWIPCDNFLPAVSTAKYSALLKSVQQSNMNMLRVWGGGIYESDAFYNVCDSLGIMIWQDFMYAGGIYPIEMMQTEADEAIYNLQRIQPHPSISLWCGNNEITEGWNNWGWQKEFHYSAGDSSAIWKTSQLTFENLLPGDIKQFCREVPYITTSPSTGWGHPEAYKSGDVHYWGVWWGMEPFSSYDNHVGRFVSEYGFQSTPPLSSFALFDTDGNFSLNDATTQAHQKHPKGFETINEYMARDYPVPAEFSDYVYVSQVMQRDGISRAIADHRKAMPYCMGTLFWQYNDCWPVTSWSSVDYYGQKKLLQYALKDLYAPLLITVTERNDSILLHVINDDTISHKCALGFAWMDMEGDVKRTGFTPFTAYTGRSMMVLGFQKKEFFEKLDKEKGVLHLVLNYENNAAIISNYYFAPTKSLALTKDPGVATDITAVTGKAGTYTIALRTVSLAKNVYLSFNDPNATFSDNGFDMLAGETKDVIITTSLSLEKLKTELKIQMMNTLVK
ncbi:glycoside hydrolase family 2 protein [soil metagenome]